MGIPPGEEGETIAPPRKLADAARMNHLPRVAPSILRTVLFALFLPACASTAPPEPVVPKRPPVAEEPAAATKRAIPAGQIRREDVLAVLSDGPPAFLSRLDVDPVQDKAGKLHGWRVVAVREEAWADVRTGDVILRVNGKRVDDPYQFFDVFQSLAFAPELAIAVERGGAPLELRWPINDDPTAPPVPRPEKKTDAPSAEPARADVGKRTSKAPGKAKKLRDE